MEVLGNNYLPGDPRLIDHIVYELKAQGIFDKFRKECISDVDTKPAYQNLRQRVEGSVVGFLKTQKWSADMNKNQVREMLRKNISESGFLETGVERIVDQVVNPKINTVFLPQVESVVYKFLGIQKPSDKEEVQEKPEINKPPTVNADPNDLLPKDLEAVSPESETMEKRNEQSFDSDKLDDSKMDEDESPPFEPIEGNTICIPHDENSIDSHLSGLISHDSNSCEKYKMEISNQGSQFSKQSSGDGHLSIDYEKMDISEESMQSKTKSNDSKADPNFNSLYFNLDKNEEKMEIKHFEEFSTKTENELEENKRAKDSKDEKLDGEKREEKEEERRNDEQFEKVESKEKRKSESDKSKVDDKKSDRHKHKSRHDKHSEKEKDRRDKDKKESKEKSSSKDSKEHKRSKEDADKIKIEKEKSDKDKTRDSKSDKDRTKAEKDKTKSDRTKEDKEQVRDDKDKNKTDKEKTKDKDKIKSDKDKVKSEKNRDKEKSKGDRDKSKDSRDRSKEKLKEKDKTKEKDGDKKDSKSSNESKHKSEKSEEGKEKSKSSSSSSKHKSNHSSKDNEHKEKEKSQNTKSSKDSKIKEKSEHSKSKDDLKPKSDSKHKQDSKSKSDTKVSSKKEDKHSSRDDKSSHNEKHKKDEKHDKSKKDSKKDSKKSNKDDHYSLKGKKWDRRSTDRDSSDGRSGNQSSQSSFSETPQKQRKAKESSASNSGSGSGDSGNSDDVEDLQDVAVSFCEDTIPIDTISSNVDFKENVQLTEMPVKLIKPKFASNIFEAKRLMKIRKQLHKIEKQSQMNFLNANKEPVNNTVQDSEVKSPDVKSPDIKSPIRFNNISPRTEKSPPKYEIVNRRPTILKRHAVHANSIIHHLKSPTENNRRLSSDNENISTVSMDFKKDEIKADVSEETDEFIPPPLANQVISKESWDALEAKLSQQNLLDMDYSSYADYSDSDSPIKKEDYEQFSQSFSKAVSEYYEPKQQKQSCSKEEKVDDESKKQQTEECSERLERSWKEVEENIGENSTKQEQEEEVTIGWHNINEKKENDSGTLEIERLVQESKTVIESISNRKENKEEQKTLNSEVEDKVGGSKHLKINQEKESVKEFQEVSSNILQEESPILQQKSSELPCKVSLKTLENESSEIPSSKSDKEKQLKSNNDFLYFCSSSALETEKCLLILRQSIEKIEQEISMASLTFTQKRKPLVKEQLDMMVKRNILSDANKVVNKKPNNAFVDMTRNNQISTTGLKRGRKRKISSEDQCDIHNNNKIANHIVNEDVPSSKVTTVAKKDIQTKKPKNDIDTVVTSDDNFSMPLSPSESENSFSAPNEKKESAFPKNSKRKSSTEKLPTKMQRYSSDDLYKPRLNFSSRRRSGRPPVND